MKKVLANGTIEYRNDKGQLHREDGPAVEWVDGGKVWFLNGKRHREGGPAVEFAGGYKAWFLNGVNHSEEEFNEKLRRLL